MARVVDGIPAHLWRSRRTVWSSHDVERVRMRARMLGIADTDLAVMIVRAGTVGAVVDELDRTSRHRSRRVQRTHW